MSINILQGHIRHIAMHLSCDRVFNDDFSNQYPTTIQAWRTCRLWEPAPSRPHFVGVDLANRGYILVFVSVCCCRCCVCFFAFCVFLFVSTSATDCLERLVSKMTNYVSSGM